MRALRIVHVVHSLELGGLENGVVNLLNRLDSQPFEHTVCCLARAGDFTRRLGRKNINIVELECGSDGFRFPLLKLGKVFRGLQADIVHTRGWGAIDAVFAARLAGVPVVIHGEHGREWNDTEGKNWKRNQIRRAIGLIANRYVVVCKYFQDWLRQTCKVPADKIVHIPNGVDTTKFRPLERELRAESLELRDLERADHSWQKEQRVERMAQGAERQLTAGRPQQPEGSSEPLALSSGLSALSPQLSALSSVRQRLGLPAEAVLIGNVGRVDPVKDIPTLLRSFSNLMPEFPNSRLVIVGDGPLMEELRNRSRSLKVDHAVCWLGRRDDVAALLRCFDIFVQSSLFEGMSNTILEAMATGLPIVATDAGGNSELVSDGVNGRLFPVGDVAALTEHLRSYLSDSKLRERHARQGRDRALKQFDLSLMTTRYAELYERLAAGTR